MSLSALAKVMDLEGDQAALELAQVRVLSSIFNKVVNREILLKGGFAMRVIANSSRPTKDIDLQANGASFERVQGLVRSAINDLVKCNILDDIKVTEPKQTDTTQRWKINGRIKDGETPVHLTIEVSRRGLIADNLINSVSFERRGFGVPPAIIECFSPTAIAAAKFEAMASPTRESPRDIFDLDVLIRMKAEPPVQIFANNYSEEELLRKLEVVADKLDKMDFQTVKSTLLPHLPAELRKNFGADEWETMRLKTYLMVDKWVQDALLIQKADQKTEREPEAAGLRM
jgi:predicted nucleotidyltransferase component of viral defense system